MVTENVTGSSAIISAVVLHTTSFVHITPDVLADGIFFQVSKSKNREF